ncbi:transposase family protein [Chromobacterium piscinae]|uniref:Transposase family protein n=1 Tax=Chromobacterium piscinae TaxID=686831 RepID=A0ABV0HA34_9NEIS
MLTLAILSSIPDHRRGQGRLFDLPHVLLCSILAVLAGADSYRSVYRFIDVWSVPVPVDSGLSTKR